MPDFISNDPFARAEFALANVMNPEAAVRAVVAPTSLPPRDRRKLSERLLGPDPGVLGAVVDAATNPLMLAGIVLSAKYPVASAAKLLDWGERLAAYAAREMPLLGRIQDFRHIFRGPIADWFDYAVRRNHSHMNHVTKKMAEFFDEYEKSGGKWNRETSRVIAAYLDGLHNPDHQTWKMLEGLAPNKRAAILEARRRIASAVRSMGTPERTLANNLRSVFDEQWQVIKKLRDNPRTKRAVDYHLESMGIKMPKWGDYQPQYFPHVEALTREEAERRFLSRESPFLHPAVTQQLRSERVAKQASKRLLARFGQMLPAPDDLKALGVWTDDLEGAYSTVIARMGKLARVMGVPLAHEYGGALRVYSLNTLKVTRDYTAGVARTLGWATPPPGATKSIGELIREELPVIRAANPEKAAILEDTYIPLVMGRTTLAQMAPSLRWANTRLSAASWIKRQKWLPPTVKETLLNPLEGEMPMTWHQLGNAVASYFYGTTLAFNLVSPVKNLFQHIVTTIPVLGPTATLRGMREVLNRYPKFLRAARTLGEDAAWRKVFPEFYDAGLDVGSITGHEKLGDLMHGELGGFAPARGAKKVLDKAMEKGLWLFTTSERFNRLSAFYAARLKAVKELPGTPYKSPYLTTADYLRARAVPLPRSGPLLEEAANRFAAHITNITQYGGGPLSSPRMTATWWAPLRQYTQYPLRTLGFALGPAMRLGGGGGLNPGTLGRALVSSGAAYYGGKALLGADVSDALLWGALPATRSSEQEPFGVLPLVPPLVQVAGGVAKSLTEGDEEPFLKQLPLLVPGGIAGVRLASVLGGPVASVVGRPFVDYSAQTPDGRYPMYSAKGALIGYYDSVGLLAKAIGLGDLQGEKEVALNKYLLRQRDRIREFRRRYTEAAAAGDTRQLEVIRKEWTRQYPGMGPLTVKKTDVQAIQFRRLAPRLERLLDSLPEDARPEFAAAIATSFGAAAPSFLGLDPALMASGSVGSRMAARVPQKAMPFVGQGRLPNPYSEGAGLWARSAAFETRDDLARNEVTPGSTPKGYLP